MKTTTPIPFIIAPFIGFVAFFVPWIGTFFGSFSGSDIHGLGQQFGIENAWILYLFPIAFLISGITKLEFTQAIPGAFIKTVEFIPILLLLYMFVRLFVAMDGQTPTGFMEDLTESLRTGFYLTVLASLIILFSPLNKKASKTK